MFRAESRTSNTVTDIVGVTVTFAVYYKMLFYLVIINYRVVAALTLVVSFTIQNLSLLGLNT
jgi:hypothetical protein